MMNRRWFSFTLVACSFMVALVARSASAEETPCKSKCNSSTACQTTSSECSKKSDLVFYILECGDCQGDQVTRVQATGKETVLDALSNIGGFAQHSGKSIWIARPVVEAGEDEILPVNCDALASGGCATNYAIQPGDRLFVVRRGAKPEHCIVSDNCNRACPTATECAGQGVNSNAGLIGHVVYDSPACSKSACEKSAKQCTKSACADVAQTCTKQACKSTCTDSPCDETSAVATACSSDKSKCCCDGATETCDENCKCERAIKTAGVCAAKCDTAKCDAAKTARCKKSACEASTTSDTSHPVLDLVDKLDPTTDGIFCPGLAVDVELEISERRAQLIDVLRELEECDSADAGCHTPEQVEIGHVVANPFQADALRQTSSALEHAAAHLEEVELFEQADAVRRLADSLRHESRQAAAKLRASFYMSAIPCERE